MPEQHQDGTEAEQPKLSGMSARLANLTQAGNGRGRKAGSKNRKTLLEDVAKEMITAPDGTALPAVRDVLDLKKKVLEVYLQVLYSDNVQYRFAAAKELARYMFPVYTHNTNVNSGEIKIVFPGLEELGEQKDEAPPKSPDA